MIRVLLFLALLALAAFGIVWILDRPGEIDVTWLGYHVETSFAVGLAIVALAAVALALLLWLLGLVLRLPASLRRRAHARRRAKGHAALSRGMIAVGAGDARLARRSSLEADRYLAAEPLTLLLAAQAAQLSGDRAGAEAAFGKLAQNVETRLLGLRGLHVEAQRRGDHEAAIHFAQEAHKIAPLPWSAKAVLDYHAGRSQWEAALAALESHIAAKLVDKKTGERQQAVLETAIALDKAQGEPEEALRLVRHALGHAPDLVPAVALAARLYARKGELRRAAKLIESAWQRQPHPELAEVYLDLRPGDSNADRLAKARALARLMPRDPESRMIVARAALAARDYPAAREAMAPLVAEDERPSVRMCLIMAELEDAETGDEGKVRQWLAKSARAPRDPAWMADGVVAANWAPVSPVTGRLDAFVWQRPPDRLAVELESDDWARRAIEAPARQIAHAPTPVPEPASHEPAPAAASGPPAAESIDAKPAEVKPAEAKPAEAKPVAGETKAAAAEVEAPRALKAGPRAVIFPMPAPPDDPGLAEEPPEEKDRVGLF
ncbi:MAG TPA: heme biosynthesis HemY N-terminal domain-containing protein [Methylovirgula sp.]|nr:heme biosynthesis HemY N-terminal domain-containing protein [Methylovirgula sp.]